MNRVKHSTWTYISMLSGILLTFWGFTSVMAIHVKGETFIGALVYGGEEGIMLFIGSFCMIIGGALIGMVHGK